VSNQVTCQPALTNRFYITVVAGHAVHVLPMSPDNHQTVT